VFTAKHTYVIIASLTNQQEENKMEDLYWMEDLDWNDYFDNDRECGGSDNEPDDFEESIEKAKIYMASKTKKQ
jgi:hypothetical protein